MSEKERNIFDESMNQSTLNMINSIVTLVKQNTKEDNEDNNALNLVAENAIEWIMILVENNYTTFNNILITDLRSALFDLVAFTHRADKTSKEKARRLTKLTLPVKFYTPELQEAYNHLGGDISKLEKKMKPFNKNGKSVVIDMPSVSEIRARARRLTALTHSS